MDESFFLITAICTGISVTLSLVVFFRAIERIEVERNMEKDATTRMALLIRIWLPLVPNTRFLARKPLFDSMRRHAEESLQMAGFGQQLNGEDFIAVRILMFFFGILLMFGLFLAQSPMLGLLSWLCFMIYPGVWLRGAVKARHMSIMRALPNVLDLLSLSVEAGKDFLNSLRDILGRRANDALGEELSRTLKEIQLGKKRAVALRDLVNRVRQPDLTSVMNSIIQADELGVSIGNLLKIQSELLRNKRFTRAEKLAAEAPVKMLFPMALFIFPAVLIILLVPIILQAAQMF